MFQLATPLFLLLIPLPFLLKAFFPISKAKKQVALIVPFFKNIATISFYKNSVDKNFSPHLIYPFIIWSLLIFALAGPQWVGKPIIFPESGRDIMLALDLSGSMQTPDMQLNNHYLDRLTVVKIAAKNFIENRKGDRLGLVLFGSHAYLQTPLTFDLDTVEQMLEDATIGLAGAQTAIGDALALAIKQLVNAPGKSKVIILLTDGGNNAGMIEPLAAAAMAKTLGIKIYAIGIGAKQLVVQGMFGPEVIHPTNSLDEQSLKEIAKITGGLYFQADNGNNLQKIYGEINQLAKVVSAKEIFRPIQPLYYWPLLLAIILSFLLVLKKIFYLERSYD